MKTFNEVLWDDLKFSGFFTLVGKSFYPPRPLLGPEDIDYDDWNQLPAKAGFLACGTLELQGSLLHADLRIVDMKQHAVGFRRILSAQADQVRSLVHRWADEVVLNLTAGQSRGIASTKIAFTSQRQRGGAKEVYVMEYDGFDPRAFTSNGSLNLFPSWAPDNSKLAFVSFRTQHPEINIYSYHDGSRLPFPMFNSFASNPAFSPDGIHLLFALRSHGGNSDVHVSRIDGSERRNITNSTSINFSPTWSPSGNQIAFISDRDGTTQLYTCDADGANVRRIVKEGGSADSPSWSPDGRWIAFHWQARTAANWDIFMVEVSSGKIYQLTANSGSNEYASWAADSRHLAFQSNRSGTNQIYIMLVDTNDLELRRITSQGENTCPAWGGYGKRD